MNQKRFTLWYFSVSIIFILFDNLHFVFPALITKALIIPSLVVFLHFSSNGKYELFSWLIMFGLFFSWLGDVILQLGDNNLSIPVSPDFIFIAGLGAFLIAQLIYFFAFTLPKGKNLIFNRLIYQALMVFIYGFTMFYLLYPGLGDMKIPVMAYTMIILLMLISALNRFGKVNRSSYILVATGAIFFVISDSLIAVNKFFMEINYAGVFIMISYVTAQYLIVLGSLRQNTVSAAKS